MAEVVKPMTLQNPEYSKKCLSEIQSRFQALKKLGPLMVRGPSATQQSGILQLFCHLQTAETWLIDLVKKSSIEHKVIESDGQIAFARPLLRSRMCAAKDFNSDLAFEEFGKIQNFLIDQKLLDPSGALKPNEVIPVVAKPKPRGPLKRAPYFKCYRTERRLMKLLYNYCLEDTSPNVYRATRYIYYFVIPFLVRKLLYKPDQEVLSYLEWVYFHSMLSHRLNSQTSHSSPKRLPMWLLRSRKSEQSSPN